MTFIFGTEMKLSDTGCGMLSLTVPIRTCPVVAA